MKKQLTKSVRRRSPRKPPALLDIALSRYVTLASLIGREKKFLDVEDIHDLRVAARRLSQVTRLITPLMDKTSADAVTDTLRDLRRSAGALRDLDVMHEHFEKWPIPAGLSPVIEPMIDAYPKEREKLLAKLLKLLSSVILTTTLNVVHRTITTHQRTDSTKTQRMLHDELCATTKKRYRQFSKALARAAKKQMSTSFHEARIAAKKLRYMLELADESGIRDVAGQLRFLKELQSDLGDMHDADMIMDELKKELRENRNPAIQRAWAEFQQILKDEQSARACRFFQASYQWKNDEQSHVL